MADKPGVASSFPDHCFDNDGNLDATGSANTYAVKTGRRIFGYYKGLRFCARIPVTNTGASTMAVDEGAALPIRKSGNAALAAGDIVAGFYYDFIYDDVNDVIQVSTSISLSSITPAAIGAVAKSGDTMTGDLFAPVFWSTNQSGGEGGELRLRVPASGHSLNGNYVTLDIFENTFRIFEDASTFRGAKLDLTSCLSDIGSVLRGGGGYQIASGSLAGATTDILNIAQNYSYLHLALNNVSFNTASRALLVQCDSDNGASFDTTASNYGLLRMAGSVSPAFASVASLIDPGVNTLVGDEAFANLFLFSYQGSNVTLAISVTFSSGGSSRWHLCQWFGGTRVNALRMLLNGSGNFDAGTYTLRGVQ